MPITPYGGTLVDRMVPTDRRAGLVREAAKLPRIELGYRILSDLYLISVGGLSPLEGFMTAAEYESVLGERRLPAGLPWTVPIILPASAAEAAALAPGEPAALVAPDGRIAGTIEVADVYGHDVEREARAVYGTADEAHPGVAAVRAMGPKYVGGRVTWLYEDDISGFPEDHLAPAATRAYFARAGWDTVVAFQTRNPIHRAHEYLQKCALEIVDGLLLHPLVGETKSDDIPADIRMECYRVLLDRYYPRDRVLLSVLPAAMRYAGPAEAIHHAIMRRNYGCTHFIVGRDHAGVGSYYGTYDAQRIFDTVDREALGIQPLMFEHSFWCTVTGQMASPKTSPSTPEQRIMLSGTKVRELLSRGEPLPPEFSRPEVAEVLRRAYRDRASAG